MADGGVVAKGPDGSIYFLRDEILEAAKVDGEELDEMKSLAEGSEVEGFAMDFSAMTTQIEFVGKIGEAQLLARNPGYRIPDLSSYSTVMCPW